MPKRMVKTILLSLETLCQITALTVITFSPLEVGEKLFYAVLSGAGIALGKWGIDIIKHWVRRRMAKKQQEI